MSFAQRELGARDATAQFPREHAHSPSPRRLTVVRPALVELRGEQVVQSSRWAPAFK
jgi:hypothetical protein